MDGNSTCRQVASPLFWRFAPTRRDAVMSATRRPSFCHEGHAALRAVAEIAVHNAGLHFDSAISRRTRMVGRLESRRGTRPMR